MNKNSELAINGGKKTIDFTFEKYNPIGAEEREAAISVINSGVLSKFIGVEGKEFYGGEKVLEFEERCMSFFDVNHAITVNSWTSGLIAAVGAIGLEPGDEVIVSPWTMSASAAAILHWNALPVFADIAPDTFCISPESIEKNITEKTRAIMSVDIFGHSADMTAIKAIAEKHDLKVISDTAQSPGADYHGRKAGTISDIGGYSLNYHKHIHTGEGGIIVTNDDEYAEKLRLIRNHAEAVLQFRPGADLANMIGFNFRLGEIESAMGIAQLAKLPDLVKRRQSVARKLSEGLEHLEHLTLPFVEENCTHVYYVYAMKVDAEKLGVTRERIADALRAEGVPNISTRYQNLHLLPMFQNKIAYGSQGFPWNAPFSRPGISYDKGICPVAEMLQDNSYIGFGICHVDLTDQDVELIVEAFTKVWKNLDQI